MLFSSVEFLFFIVAFLLVYYAAATWLPNRLKNYVLIVFSLFFYCFAQPIYLPVLVGIALLDWLLGLLLRKTGHKKLYLIIALCVNIGTLAFFKYVPTEHGMPIGISFFIFSSISYCVDVYREPEVFEPNFANYLMYLSMFPKLINGPIVKYIDIKEEISERKVDFTSFTEGGERFVIGLIKKVLLANTLAGLFDAVKLMEAPSLLSAWLGLIAYTLQIYLDFSAYSDMAIGLGRMAGFSFRENFNYPYTATSLTDFWRRWHISLSQFFRDYVYIPLGGNRVPVWRHILNLLIVWALTGIWHGSTLNFVLWGLYYGILLILEKYVFKNIQEKLPLWLRRIITMLLVMFGWCLFAFPNFTQLGSYLGNLFNFGNFADASFLYYAKNYLPELVLGIFVCMPFLKNWLEKKHAVWLDVVISLVTLALFVLVISSLIRDSYTPFLYFDF